MVTIPLRTRLQPDGTLDLRISTGLPESDVEVLIVLQPADSRSSLPAEFFAETYGAFAESPLERPAQGAWEVRESLR
jgi:hypothetical protein